MIDTDDTMLFDDDLLRDVQTGHTTVVRFYRSIRHMYGVIDELLAKSDFPARLVPVPGEQLATLSPGCTIDVAAPWCDWISPWIGRFYYRDRESDAANGRHELGLIWVWTGHFDPFVETAEVPEIWVGVADPGPMDTRAATAFVWNNMRYESGQEQDDGWRRGDFKPHGDGGVWKLRRIPLSRLRGSYDVQSMVVRTMVDQFVLCFDSGREDASPAPR